MAERPEHVTLLVDAMSAFWTTSRLATLSRITQHQRQFEAWWKWELATHLWEVADTISAQVFVEANHRADITLATPIPVKGAGYNDIDPQGTLCASIELKTTGTWWGKTPGAIDKALAGTSKPLAKDLESLAARSRRVCPFGMVALVITDPFDQQECLEQYVLRAAELGSQFQLHEVLRMRLPLPRVRQSSPNAVQMVWALW